MYHQSLLDRCRYHSISCYINVTLLYTNKVKTAKNEFSKHRKVFVSRFLYNTTYCQGNRLCSLSMLDNPFVEEFASNDVIQPYRTEISLQNAIVKYKSRQRFSFTILLIYIVRICCTKLYFSFCLFKASFNCS